MSHSFFNFSPSNQVIPWCAFGRLTNVHRSSNEDYLQALGTLNFQKCQKIHHHFWHLFKNNLNVQYQQRRTKGKRSQGQSLLFYNYSTHGLDNSRNSYLATKGCVALIQISQNLWTCGHYYSFLFFMSSSICLCYLQLSQIEEKNLSEKMIVPQQCNLTILQALKARGQ